MDPVATIGGVLTDVKDAVEGVLPEVIIIAGTVLALDTAWRIVRRLLLDREENSGNSANRLN